MRRVKTASGATAVQIVYKRGRRVLSIEHIGSAHTDDELALLLQVAEERRHAGQLALELDDAGAGVAGPSAVVEGTSSLILWEVLPVQRVRCEVVHGRRRPGGGGRPGELPTQHVLADR